MAGAAVSVALGGNVTYLTSRATVVKGARTGARGIALENSERRRSVTTGSRHEFLSRSFSSDYFIPLPGSRTRLSLQTTRRASLTTKAVSIPNSVFLGRTELLQRGWKSGSRNARRVLPIPAGLPVMTRASFLSQMVDRTCRLLASLLPGKALVEKVEAEVDAAASMVHEGAEIVTDIANKVEALADSAELRTDEVERIAEKIIEVTDKIKKNVTDVANVLEGEEGTSASTLVQSIEQLKRAAADARAAAAVKEGQEGISPAAVTEISEHETTVVLTPLSNGTSERPARFIPAGLLTRASQIHLSHMIDRTYKHVTTLLPGKAVAEKVEAEVNSAAVMVHDGAEIVSDIANRMETLANTAELGAEEVERIAQKIMEVTSKIKKTVDDVANVLEGEETSSASALVQSIAQLRKAEADVETAVAIREGQE